MADYKLRSIGENGTVMGTIASITGEARAGLCVLAAETERWTGRIRGLSACGAFIETGGRPGLGEMVALAHTEAGSITACVRGHAADGVAIGFELTEESSAFAFAVHANDMTRAA